MTAFRTVVVADPLGLHARPAAEFVTAARGFDSKLQISKGAKQANCKSLLSVLTLGISQGTSVTIEGTGADEAEAIDALASLLETNHGATP